MELADEVNPNHLSASIEITKNTKKLQLYNSLKW